MNDETEYTRFSGQGKIHDGPARTAPYPVSRLAAPVTLVDLAREIDRADRLLASHVEGKLAVIARQIRNLQEEAREILDKVRRDQELHRARCAFRRRVGQTYFLYRKEDGSLWFSMLSPEEWGGGLADRFEGAYRLETDMSWTPVHGRDGKYG